jgi:uncharacterized C2H2 Zn-finger protein
MAGYKSHNTFTGEGGEGEEMTCNISRCSSCGEFFNSKKELKDHINKNHRITNSKIALPH